MGIISLEHTDRLYWLGRYTERVYTTLRLYIERYDELIDGEPLAYRRFCAELDIPDIYGSKEEFEEKYPFDTMDPNSIISNLNRAYDNAIVLREEIGSEVLAYIQLAIYDIQTACRSKDMLMGLQEVLDHILAFWGIADDMIESEQVRNIIKTGKRVERLDLYARLGMPTGYLIREVDRMRFRLERSGMDYNKTYVEDLIRLVKEEKIDYYRIVNEVETILEV